MRGGLYSFESTNTFKTGERVLAPPPAKIPGSFAPYMFKYIKKKVGKNSYELKNYSGTLPAEKIGKKVK